MERGNTEQGRSHEQATPPTERNLGRAAIEGAETARAADRQRNLGQKTLATATLREIPPELDINRFDVPALAKLYPSSEIAEDRHYVAECKRRQKESEERARLNGTFEESRRAQTRAKNLEMMFLYGVQRNAWLGNTLNVFGEPPFTTETSATTEYDDNKHRIDAFTSLKFTRTRPDERYEAGLTRVVMGFDVTISGRRDKIIEKLTICNNNKQAKLPFGFSQIKYFIDGRAASKQLLVPRYTIAIDGEQVDNLREMAHIQRRNGRIVDMRFNPGQSNMTRFMILSEIRAQNELYRAMLPDKIDTDQLKKADMTLTAISEQLDAALDQCVDRMTGIKWVMGDYQLTPQDVRTPEERAKLRQYVLQRVIDRRRSDYLEKSEEITMRSHGGFLPPNYRPDPSRSDAFVQMMQCTQELTDKAKQGKLNAYRIVSAHTKNFINPKKRR